MFLRSIRNFYFCLIPFILIFPPAGYGDDNEPSFEDLHSDQPVICLLKQEEVKVNPDWSFTRKITLKLKVQKDEARGLGEVTITYDHERDRIIDQKIFSITPDGKKHPPIKVQDMTVYDGQPMYSNAMVRVLSLPQVGVGTIIEKSYTLASRGLTMKNAFWEMQFIRMPGPTKEYMYTITFPEKLGIQYREFGLSSKPTITHKNGWVSYHWELSDISDEDQGEEYTPPPSEDDPMEGFEFSSIKSWDDLGRWYAGLVEKNMILTPEIKTAAESVAGGFDLVRDKVRAVLEYIQDNFRYVSMSFGENAYEPHPIKEVFANKYGDCKDLSLLARAMLSVVGVKADIALFGYENSINDPSFDLPIPELFSHALLYVHDPLTGDFYADPLLKGYDIGQYPLNFQQAYTFIITPGGGRFGRLPVFDEERSAEYATRVIDMEEDWSGIIEVSKVWDLDSSISTRNAFKAMNEAQKAELYTQLDFMLTSGGEVMERDFKGLDLRYGRMRSTVKFRRPDEFPSADGLIVINLDSLDRDAAFEKEERQQDFFFPVNALIESEDIYRIPEGFEVFYVPSDFKMERPEMSYSRSFKRTPLGVTVKESFRLKRVRLKKEALADLRKFRAELSRQSRQRLVFKRKSKTQ